MDEIKAKAHSLLCMLFLLLTLCAPVTASAQDMYNGSNVDVRTILYFKVSPAALSKFLPEGWELSPATIGPTAGANLQVEFVDQLWAISAEGVVRSPYRAQTQHFCYEPPISRNQLIGKGVHRCHVF